MDKKTKTTKKAVGGKAVTLRKQLVKGESLYTPGLLGQIGEMISLVKPIKSNGELEVAKLAKLLRIPIRTFSRWRNPESEYYKPKLAVEVLRAHAELIEGIDAGQIKRGQIARAKPYKRVKRFKELKTVGPEIPALGSMDKKGLLAVAGKIGLRVNNSKKLTKGQLQVRITAAVEKQTKDVMVTVRQEEEQMHGDTVAAKFVLPHIGPKDERWVDTKNENITVDGLSRLLGEIDGSGSRLPDKD